MSDTAALSPQDALLGQIWTPTARRWAESKLFRSRMTPSALDVIARWLISIDRLSRLEEPALDERYQAAEETLRKLPRKSPSDCLVDARVWIAEDEELLQGHRDAWARSVIHDIPVTLDGNLRWHFFPKVVSRAGALSGVGARSEMSLVGAGEGSRRGGAMGAMGWPFEGSGEFSPRRPHWLLLSGGNFKKPLMAAQESLGGAGLVLAHKGLREGSGVARYAARCLEAYLTSFPEDKDVPTPPAVIEISEDFNIIENGAGVALQYFGSKGFQPLRVLIAERTYRYSRRNIERMPRRPDAPSDDRDMTLEDVGQNEFFVAVTRGASRLAETLELLRRQNPRRFDTVRLPEPLRRDSKSGEISAPRIEKVLLQVGAHGSGPMKGTSSRLNVEVVQLEGGEVTLRVKDALLLPAKASFNLMPSFTITDRDALLDFLRVATLGSPRKYLAPEISKLSPLVVRFSQRFFAPVERLERAAHADRLFRAIPPELLREVGDWL